MISIVMTTYNGEKYIIEQLDSIRRQTVPCDELIICDDLSTDKTIPLVNAYIKQYNLMESWKVNVNAQNMGYENNFNQAIDMANGDYIFFSDQDDIWNFNKIETMVKIMKEHEDCMLLCSDYEPYIMDEYHHKIPKNIIKNMPDNGKLSKVVLDNKSIYIGALGCCMAIKRDFYIKVKPFWFDKWPQDDRMWRLAQCLKGCYILHSNLVKHRIHGNNTSTYVKYHTLNKRVDLFIKMQNANMQMLKILERGNNENQIKIMKNHIMMMDLRIEMLQKGKICNAVYLLKYLKYYEKTKSFLVDMYILIKNK